ncbi:MAG: SDR family oxidoreductase [Verrucomicrobiae bacterium]|nr:SDR family oxidoreductase [Verrucomicrobiae bacterium]
MGIETATGRPLEGRVWLIAGTTGIAAATAERAAAEGASICLVGRNPVHGETLKHRVRAQGVSCEWVLADLTEDDAGDRIVGACTGHFGRIDAAFNAAGISGRRYGDGPAHACTAEGWDAVMNTNARGLFLLCGALTRQMLRQPMGADGLRGSILNMASVLGWSPSPRHFGTHAYAASKAAILGFSRAMAAQYASDRIRVNAIAPALVRTPMSARAQQDAEIGAFLRTKQPLLGDFLTAEQVADAAVFLLGPRSVAITGDVLVVDGGWCVSEGQWR